MNSRSLAAVFAALTALSCGQAFAQNETLLVQPSLPDDFDRGRNISVLQRARPDYDPIGVRLGSFNVFPQVDIGAGYTSNVFYSRGDNAADDGYAIVSPQVRVVSDWSRHQLQARASANIQRFFTYSLRNQEPWNVQVQGTLELGEALRIIPEVQIARQFETPFSGEASTDTAVLSNYLRKYGGIRAEYGIGRTKLTLAIDDTNYQFSDVQLRSGSFIDQGDRDRNIVRVTGQAQYAFTPSLAAYAQLAYVDTAYDEDVLLIGGPNRDSTAYRAIVGVNFDLASLLRGTIGVGYTKRDFDAALYGSVDGFSAEGKLEYFPTDLTTITATIRRVIEDSSLGGTSAYFDNRATLRVDHELLNNLLLNGFAEIARQDFIDSEDRADIYRLGGGAVYLSSNWLSLNLNLSYTGRTRNNTTLGQKFNEFRGQVGVTFKR